MSSTVTLGQTVTLDIPNAWHYGLTGTVVDTRNGGDMVTVLFAGHGRVHVPAAVVRPV